VNLGIWLPFIVAAALKSAQGSSTVAIITSASLMAPLMGSLGLNTPLALALTVVAIGAGSMVVSHANDSYFWVVSQFSRMKGRSSLQASNFRDFTGRRNRGNRYMGYQLNTFVTESCLLMKSLREDAFGIIEEFY